jgi:hypothetical protein
MQLKPTTILTSNNAKYALICLFGLLIGFGAYATIGVGKKKSAVSSSAILSSRKAIKPGTFSLKSGYNFRGNTILNQNPEQITVKLNTTVSVQKGNANLSIPLKKNVLIGRVKIELGNRQFQ